MPAPLPIEYALPEGYAEEFEEALEAALQAWVPPDVGGEGEPVQEGHPDAVEENPPEPAGGDLEDDRGASDPDNSVLSDAVAGRLLRSAWWGPFHLPRSRLVRTRFMVRIRWFALGTPRTTGRDVHWHATYKAQRNGIGKCASGG